MFNIYGGVSTLFHLIIRFPLIILFFIAVIGGVVYKSHKNSTPLPVTKLEAIVSGISTDASAFQFVSDKPPKNSEPVREFNVTRVDGIPVIGYHHIIVDDETHGDQMVISLSRFIEEMKYLHDNGYQTLSISELVDVMTKRSPLPKKAVVLTFDDGFASVLIGLPILEAYNLKASFQIITSYAGVSPSWQKYVTWDQIKMIASNPNFEIESHTVTHPYEPNSNLVTWSEGKTKNRGKTDVMSELADSKFSLERNLGKPVKFLAWPSGYYNKDLIELAKSVGYVGAMTTDENVNRPGDDPFLIKRLFIDGSCNVDKFAQMLSIGKNVTCK